MHQDGIKGQEELESLLKKIAEDKKSLEEYEQESNELDMLISEQDGVAGKDFHSRIMCLSLWYHVVFHGIMWQCYVPFAIRMNVESNTRKKLKDNTTRRKLFITAVSLFCCLSSASIILPADFKVISHFSFFFHFLLKTLMKSRKKSPLVCAKKL